MATAIEHVRTANDANAAVWGPEHSQGLLERSPGGVPEQRLFIRRVGRDGGDVAGEDQAAAQTRARLLFVRMAAMHHHIDRVERALEEALISVELELVRHDAGRFREHAVFGNNGITFDAGRPGHGSHCWLSTGRRKPDMGVPDLGARENTMGACVLPCPGHDEA